MLGSLIKFVVMVGMAAIGAIILTRSFDIWYNDCETRRRDKWERKHGGRYE